MHLRQSFNDLTSMNHLAIIRLKLLILTRNKMGIFNLFQFKFKKRNLTKTFLIIHGLSIKQLFIMHILLICLFHPVFPVSERLSYKPVQNHKMSGFIQKRLVIMLTMNIHQKLSGLSHIGGRNNLSVDPAHTPPRSHSPRNNDRVTFYRNLHLF